MNQIVKRIVEAFYNNEPTIIEGPNEKTWNLNGFSISLTNCYMKYFAILASKKEKFDWFIHFENETEPNVPYTDEEKDILFKALANNIKKGAVITTEGGVTPGGISALKKLENYGFKIIGKHSGKSVYWASDRLLDKDKLNKWLNEPNHKSDFKIIDNTKPISKDNVKPVVAILKKI